MAALMTQAAAIPDLPFGNLATPTTSHFRVVCLLLDDRKFLLSLSDKSWMWLVTWMPTGLFVRAPSRRVWWWTLE